jgi:hypothetical protein
LKVTFNENPEICRIDDPHGSRAAGTTYDSSKIDRVSIVKN